MAAPLQDGTWGDQPMHPQPSAQEADQRGEHSVIAQSSRAADWCGAARRPRAAAPATPAFLQAGERPRRTSQPHSRMKIR